METTLTPSQTNARNRKYVLVPQDVHDALRQIAFDERSQMQEIATDLIRDGLARRQSERRQLATA